MKSEAITILERDIGLASKFPWEQDGDSIVTAYGNPLIESDEDSEHVSFNDPDDITFITRATIVLPVLIDILSKGPRRSEDAEDYHYRIIDRLETALEGVKPRI